MGKVKSLFTFKNLVLLNLLCIFSLTSGFELFGRSQTSEKIYRYDSSVFPILGKRIRFMALTEPGMSVVHDFGNKNVCYGQMYVNGRPSSGLACFHRPSGILSGTITVERVKTNSSYIQVLQDFDNKITCYANAYLNGSPAEGIQCFLMEDIKRPRLTNVIQDPNTHFVSFKDIANKKVCYSTGWVNGKPGRSIECLPTEG